MKKQVKNKKQFTLIELIIVIVVIGILAGMALPKFLGVQRNAKVAAMETDLDVIEKAVMQYVTATDDGSYPFVDVNGDNIINEEDLYFKTGTIPQTLTDSLLKASGDDGSKIYKLDMEKLKPYISKIKYPDTEYVYSPNSDTAIDPIGKADGDNFIHHIIGSGISTSNNKKEESYFKDIVLGKYIAVGINNDEDVYVWGKNVGLTPQKYTLPNDIKVKSAIACGESDSFLLAIGADGELYAWGNNFRGQLGVGDKSNRQTPEKIILETGVKPVEVAGGYNHSVAIGDDGNIYTWGYNFYAQLGDDTVIDKLTPQKVTIAEGVKPVSIHASVNDSMMVGDDGNIYAWGNSYTYVSYKDYTKKPIKIELPNGVKCKKLSMSNNNYLAIGDDGELYAWGFNSNGESGVGAVGKVLSPTKISLDNNVKPIDAIAGDFHSLALGNDGNVYSWGSNMSGNLGIGNKDTSFIQLSPKKISLSEDIKPKKIITNTYSSMILTKDNTVYAWGTNANLGFQNNYTKYSPTKVPLNTNEQEYSLVPTNEYPLGETNIFSPPFKASYEIPLDTTFKFKGAEFDKIITNNASITLSNNDETHKYSLDFSAGQGVSYGNQILYKKGEENGKKFIIIQFNYSGFKYSCKIIEDGVIQVYFNNETLEKVDFSITEFDKGEPNTIFSGKTIRNNYIEFK